MQIVTAKELGDDTFKSVAAQDSFGRIFVGSHSLLVFDGQTWKSYPKPGSYSLTALTPATDGIIWAGSTNELGFFKEETVGEFKFHSLLGHLPEEARNVGTIWRCGPVGSHVYFVGRDKLLRWDGQGFQITSFPTNRRLAPARIGEEFWFQHLETGLYRLTEKGPELQFTANQLPEPLVIGLFRDESGLVTVTNEGLRRPGAPGPFSPKRLNEYLAQHVVTGFSELPDSTLAICTFSGGMVLTTRTGEIIRILADPSTGLPGRAISFLSADSTGEIYGTTPADFFHFPADGHASVFNGLNGLRSRAVNHMVSAKSGLHAATEDGIYRQAMAGDGHTSFQPLPGLNARYTQILPYDDGFLMARFGGVDWFDGSSVRAAYTIQAQAASLIVRSKTDAKSFYVGEQNGVARLVHRPDGSFERSRFLELADLLVDLHEDTVGRLWIGMPNGAFIYDLATKHLAPINDPESGQPLAGRVNVVGDERRILLFNGGRILQTSPQGGPLRSLPGLPAITAAVIQHVPGEDRLFVACRRANASSGPLHRAGILSFAADGSASWRELSIPSLGSIGSIRATVFSEENRRPVLWLGGMEGILRLDYAHITTLPHPPAPIIKLAGTPPLSTPAGSPPQYSFKDHELRFRVFTSNFFQSKDWLFQFRFADSAQWSLPSTRRSADYANLSEGTYRFEVRAVNTGGMVSPPASYVFRILPPWYRSTQAFLGYGAALLIAVFGFIRIRERRIRARNQELESLVNVRTAELVKASAAKDEFLAGVSHEIRNPMNGVIGIAENFRTEGLDLESRRKFSLLRQCASHLSSLLEDILDFSKVQAGAIELDPKPFDLVDLVESVGAITRPDSEKYGIPVELAVSPAVPRELVGDARRIRQILINFVSNALKFSGRGQVSVTVWCKNLGPAQTEVIFAVSDEGPGISAEEQTRLFTRFERGAAAQKGRVPGTGLGLALCKGIAEKMGGRIWLESELGHGSCFYFSAPFALAEAPAEEATAITTAAAPAARTALVVDDQEYNRIVLADQLQSMGFIVHSAQEGSAALNLAAKQVFDVIFLDFNLPGLSGVDVARGIRALPNASAHALILATTAFTTPEKRAQCLDAGMDAFLGKPVTRERLAKALANLAPPAAPTVTAAARPPADRPAPASTGPADRLGNLRLLARKKGVPFADELALYLSELEAEFDQLKHALRREDAAEAGRYAHMLCGRCSFVYERDLEQTQRKIESAVGSGQWAEARRLEGEFAAQLADLRVRLASSGPAAPPA
jgi:signal transduction histidine kinase/DNA-binding response OmpR family regulator